MFSSTQPVSLGYLPDHLASQAARSRRLGKIAPVIQPAQLLQTVIVDPARHIVERVAQEMHIAPLIGRLRQSLAQRRSEPGVIVGDDKLDTVQTTRLQPHQKIPPTRSALAVG